MRLQTPTRPLGKACDTCQGLKPTQQEPDEPPPRGAQTVAPRSENKTEERISLTGAAPDVRSRFLPRTRGISRNCPSDTPAGARERRFTVGTDVLAQSWGPTSFLTARDTNDTPVPTLHAPRPSSGYQISASATTGATTWAGPVPAGPGAGLPATAPADAQTGALTAIVFSLMPPTGRIFPVSDTSPVMATFCLTGQFMASDSKAVTMVHPALGPSFGVAPCLTTKAQPAASPSAPRAARPGDAPVTAALTGPRRGGVTDGILLWASADD